jgi:hypothetical protein
MTTSNPTNKKAPDPARRFWTVLALLALSSISYTAVYASLRTWSKMLSCHGDESAFAIYPMYLP